jgi:hypothetical protein
LCKYKEIKAKDKKKFKRLQKKVFSWTDNIPIKLNTGLQNVVAVLCWKED